MTTQTQTTIPDGIYFVHPDGCTWIAGKFRDGHLVAQTEASNADTHAAAGDAWSGVVPDDADPAIDDDDMLTEAVIAALLGGGGDGHTAAVTRYGAAREARREAAAEDMPREWTRLDAQDGE